MSIEKGKRLVADVGANKDVVSVTAKKSSLKSGVRKLVGVKTDDSKLLGHEPDKLLLKSDKERTLLPSPGMLKLIQIKSPIGRQCNQRATLVGLGLNKLNRVSVVEDTASNRGMVRTVKHLIRLVTN